MDAMPWSEESLEKWRSDALSHGPYSDLNRWLATLDALRARLAEVEQERDEALAEVGEYEQLTDLQRRREQPWIEQWRVETGQPLSLPDYGQMLNWILDKAYAAQARVRVLEEVLKRGDP